MNAFCRDSSVREPYDVATMAVVVTVKRMGWRRREARGGMGMTQERNSVSEYVLL
jgi:hypothetical protein